MLLTTLRLRSLLSRVVGTTSRRVNSSSSSTPPFLPPVPEAALASLPRQLRHPSSPTLSPPPSNSPSTSLQKLSAGPKTPSSSPLSLLSTLDRQSSTPLQATSTDLLNYLRLSAENPSSPPQPLEALVQMMSGEICLLMTGTREEVAELAQRQLERASNIEQGVDVATWVLDVLEGAETRERRALARHLVICTFQELLNTTTRRPRPSLEPLLDLLVSRQEQIRPAFYEGPPPLLLLLEQFSKTYINDLERLKSSSATPPPEDGVSGLELLRVEYLDGVRAIHEALKEVANGRTMRSEILLMEAYGLGRSFKEVWQIWDGMNAEGGVGANTAAVKVYYEACGISHSLSRAVSTWNQRRSTSRPLKAQEYYAFRTCLCLCGAWDELVASFSEQQAQHLLLPAIIPPLTPPALLQTLNLIKQGSDVLDQPPVDQEDVEEITRRIQEATPEEMWEEAERLSRGEDKRAPPRRKGKSEPGKCGRETQEGDPSSPQPRPAPKSQSHFSTPLRGRALLSPSRSPPPPRTTTSSLLPHLRRFAEDSSSSPTPPDEVAAVLAGERALEVTGTQEEVEEVSSRLMSPATTLEQGVEIATRVLKATETSREDLGTRGLVYSLIHDLHQLVERIHPRPSPVPLLDFFVPRQGRIRLTFNASQNPLVSLLEIYSRLYAQDRRRLDPRSEAPSPGVVVELESLRVEHLAAVRDIHSARKETTAWKSTVRSETTLMGAYNQGRSFEEVWEIWGAMKAEGGVGLDHRAVAVYFDACGFSGSLPRAVSTWTQLKESNFTLDDNNYEAYQECLVRCGAWEELVAFLSDRQANPEITPVFTAASLAAMIKLAKRLVKHPRHRTFRDVDTEQLNRLQRGIQQLVPKELWTATERLRDGRNRFNISVGAKTVNKRRGPRDYTLDSASDSQL